MVDVYINSVRVAKGTGFKSSKKSNNDKTDTFDGPDYTHDEFPEYTVSIDRIDSYNTQYESILDKAVEANPDGIPIVIIDGNLKYTFTGCFIESEDDSRDPKKKMTHSLSFMAKTRKKEWT